jgi:hypothetical protein
MPRIMDALKDVARHICMGMDTVRRTTVPAAARGVNSRQPNVNYAPFETDLATPIDRQAGIAETSL